MSMRVLLTDPDAEPSSATVLVFSQVGGSSFETLAGESVDAGFVAEVDGDVLTDAVYSGARERDDEYVTPKNLTDDVRRIHRALADFQPGSKFGVKMNPGGDGYTLDDTEATQINRAEGLEVGDEVAVGPSVSPKTFFNAHGKAVSITGDTVEVALDPGDRDRVARATGKTVSETISFPLAGLEKTG